MILLPTWGTTSHFVAVTFCSKGVAKEEGFFFGEACCHKVGNLVLGRNKVGASWAFWCPLNVVGYLPPLPPPSHPLANNTTTGHIADCKLFWLCPPHHEDATVWIFVAELVKMCCNGKVKWVGSECSCCCNTAQDPPDWLLHFSPYGTGMGANLFAQSGADCFDPCGKCLSCWGIVTTNFTPAN